MTDYRANTYSDDDMRSVIEQIEKLEAQKGSARMTAAAECSALAGKIKATKKEAKELGIPMKVLNPILRRRKLERQISELGVDEEYAEVYEDAAGQFCMFAPVERDEPADPAKPWADDEAVNSHEDEQIEGEKILARTAH